MGPQKILITGAGGFIGSHLAERLLSERRQVVGVDNFCDFYPPQRKRNNISSLSESDRFTLAELDIRDREQVAQVVREHRPDTVVHLAAMAGVRPSIAQPDYYTQVNLNGTVNVLDAAVGHQVERFVFASSSSVYGNNKKVPFCETDPVDHPISPYAATKKAGELICHVYWHLHRMPITALRFFTVYGPRQRPDLAISQFMDRIHRGQPICMFGDGSTSRDYTYVDDIVTGICRALERCGDHGFRVYNLGGKRPVALRDMIATIERAVGKAATVDTQPMQPGDVDRTWAELSRSETELDYRPTTGFEEGVAKQWEWYRSEFNTAAR